MRIKGSLFVDIPKSYQKPSAEKRSLQGHLKDFVQTQGQTQDRARATFERQKKTNKDIKTQA